jgi:hypothetical protein
MLFRRSGSELFDTFTNIILLRIFPLQNIYSWKMLRKLKWQILAARHNWCQGPVPGRGPAVEKHWSKTFLFLRIIEPDNTMYAHKPSRNVPVIFVRFWSNLNFIDRFSEVSPNIKFNKNPSSGSRVVPCQTDGRDEADSHFSKCCERA